MAQEEFTDVQPIQQAKQQTEQGQPEEFTDVQPIQKTAPSTPKKIEGVRPPIDKREDTSDPYKKGMLDVADEYYTGALAPKSTDYDTLTHTQTRAVPKTLAREAYEGVKTIGGFIPGMYHAFADEPTEEEKNKYSEFEKQSGEAPGTETKGLKRIGLGVNRMIGGDAIGNAAHDYGLTPDNFGRSHSTVTPEAALSVAPEAVGSGAGNVVAGELLHRGLKSPEVRQAAAPVVRAVSKGVSKVLPAAPYVAGAAAGHPYIGAKVYKAIVPDAIAETVEKGKVYGLPEEEAAHQQLEERAKTSEKAAAKTQAEVDRYKASKVQGVEPPEDVIKANDKAQSKAAEDRFHADTAREAADKAKAPAKADEPITTDHMQGFQRDIDSLAPRVKPAEPPAPPAPKAINVKGPGEVQPERVGSPDVNPANVNEGETLRLPNNQGVRVGKPKLLSDVNPEAPKQEVLPPEKKTKPERGNVRALTVDEKGNVVDKEETQEGRVESLLREGLKSEEPKPVANKMNESGPKNTDRFPAMSERLNSFKNKKTGTIRTEAAPEAVAEVPKKNTKLPENYNPENDQVGVREKLEHEAMNEKRGSREQVKTPERSAEAASVEHKTHEQVANLSDENLKKLAKAHGLDPESYDFKARDEGRHRVDRDQLAKDITAKMGDDELQNIASNAQNLDNPAIAGFAKADRAAKVFPRLRGPVDEFGNPTASGGSQGVEEEKATGYSQKADKRYPATTDVEAEKLKEHVAKTSGQDTDHVAQAKAELGENAYPSDVLRRAQELKDAAKKTSEAEPLKPTPKANNLAGEEMTHTNHLEGGNKVQDVVTRNADGKKIGEILARETKPGELTVRSNQVYDQGMQGKGRGTDQLRHLLSNTLEDVNTVKSDISTSEAARGVWDKMMKQFPDAISKQAFKDGQVQYTIDMNKYREPIDVAKGANDYNTEAKLPKIEPEKVEKDTRAAEVADDYQKMKHEPNDPYVKKSYKALIDDVKKQWDYATKKLGIKIVPTDTDPYTSYEQMKDDVNKNKQMKVWRGGNPLPEDHPLAQVDPKTGENFNTMFRAVHDIFGHVAQDHDFSEPGEESAWNVHRQMMTPDAVPAMTTETRGQTSWFFNNEGVRGGEPLGKFADQKAGLLPEYANERTPDAGKTLDHIKSGKDFAVLTAENPDNARISDAENAARNRKLVAELRDKGYKPVPVEGNTKDVEGQKEHSFFVPDITPKDAAQFGRDHGQAAVLTTKGLHDLKTDKISPSDNAKVMVGDEARNQPYYSRVGDQDFSVPIDFSKEEPLDKRAGQERRTNEEGPIGEERRKAERRASLTSPDKLQDSLNKGLMPKTPFDVTEGANDTIKRDAELPKHPSETLQKPVASMETARMSDADLLKQGFTREQIRNGEHLPSVSGGSQAAGAVTAKSEKLPKLAEENLSPEEKAGVTKSQAGRDTFVDNLMKMPSVKEATDIAKAGEGGKAWYQRSTKAFEHLMDEAPRYFKEGDRKPFLDFTAALSPQQSVAMNLREALHTWTQYVDEGRPTGKALDKLLKDNLTLPGAKIPNAMKALSGQPLWPDLSKNSNFKVPSFGDNLSGNLDRVTNDGWMALFHGVDAKGMAKANVYHAASAVTRAAADALGWKPAEAQAAIWAFTKVLTEHGEHDPKIIRQYSEDYADIMRHDPETRQLLQKLGVDLGNLDTKLGGIGEKPQITPGASPTTENSTRKLTSRIETARGKGAVPQPKSGLFGYIEEPDKDVEFNPEKLEEDNRLKTKKSRLGKATK